MKTNSIAAGIENQLFSEGVKLFPNPANNILNLEFSVGYKIYRLRIFNLIGDEVFAKDINGSSVGNGKIIEKIDVSKFSSGMYSLSIQTETQKAFKKLIIQ